MAAFFINLINSVIKGLGMSIAFIMALFPDSPFGNPSAPPSNVNLGWITWVFDFPTWIVHFSALLMAISIYYFVRIAARWLKAVRS